MNLLVAVTLLLCTVSCMAAPKGFSLANMIKMAEQSGHKSTRSGAMTGEAESLGDLETLHAVGITTHPTDSNKLIYADETALYEFDKQSGESRMIAGGESVGLLAHRSSVDGVGTEAKFKFVTKIITRMSGVYVFDYDNLRLYKPEENSVQTITTLFNADWMESRGIVTGTVNEAEDRVYFSNIEGFGHFVLSISLPDGDFSTAELVAAGPSLISSLELSGDQRYIFIGDVDAKTLVRITVGEPGSEVFVNMIGKPFYPGSMAAMNEEKILVVNSLKKSVQALDVNTLTELDALCNDNCFSSPLDLTVDQNEQMAYVLDTTNHPTLPTRKATIKAISVSTTDGPEKTGKTNEEQRRYYDFMNYYNKWISQHPLYKW